MANSTGKKQQGSTPVKVAGKAPSAAGVRSPLAIPFTIKRIPVDRIRRYKRQPRTFFDKHKMKSLRESMETLGQGDPISVKIIRDDPDHDYEIVNGERRWRAARKAGQKTIVAMVYEIEDELTQFKLSLLKNSGNAPHQPLEIVDAIARLDAEECPTAEIAHLLSVHIITVSVYRRLSKLSDEVRELMSPGRPRKERLTFSAALQLVELPPEKQLELGRKSATGELSFKRLKHAVRKAAAGQSRVIGDASVPYRNPNKDYTMFNTLVENMTEDLDLWRESSPEDYLRIFACRDDADRRRIMKRLDDAVRFIKIIQQGLASVNIRHVGPRVHQSATLPRIASAS